MYETYSHNGNFWKYSTFAAAKNNNYCYWVLSFQCQINYLNLIWKYASFGSYWWVFRWLNETVVLKKKGGIKASSDSAMEYIQSTQKKHKYLRHTFEHSHMELLHNLSIRLLNKLNCMKSIANLLIICNGNSK